jgi:hypothetical protein
VWGTLTPKTSQQEVATYRLIDEPIFANLKILKKT